MDQLGKKRGKEFVGRIHDELSGYGLYPHFYNCADYGMAQTRVRFVVVGRSKNVRTGFRIPGPTVKRWVTVGEALHGIPEPPRES